MDGHLEELCASLGDEGNGVGRRMLVDNSWVQPGQPSGPSGAANGDGGIEGTFHDLLRGLAFRYESKAMEVKVLSTENASLRRLLGESDSNKGLLHSQLKSSPAWPPGVVPTGHSDNKKDESLARSDEESRPSPAQTKRSTPGQITASGEEEAEEEVATRPRATPRTASCFQDFTAKRFPPKEGWTRPVRQDRRMAKADNVDLAERKSGALTHKIENQVETYDGVLRPFIAYPSSTLRLVWDFVGAILIFVDLFAIPVTIMFQPEDTAFSIGMDWFTLLFWTINMGLSITVGYVHKGITIMSPVRILVHYFKTWFIIDLLVVGPDWIFTIANMSADAGSGSSNEELIKLLRILRLIRMMRLLRLLKLRKILQEINDLIDSEFVGIFVNIAKMILLLLIINHIIGCIWFGLGTLTPESSGPNWIREFSFDDDHWSYQYVCSLHWSITQFTPASMHVQPMNMTERTFAVAVVVFGLAGFSYVVGSITGSLTQLRSMSEDTAKQFWDLRRFMKQNRVPLSLSSRIQRYLEHVWQSRTEKLDKKDVKIFKLLSEQLESELKCQLFVPHLKVHPLFDQLHQESEVTMNRIANSGISEKQLAPADEIFIHGEIATCMYFLSAGQLAYDQGGRAAVTQQEIMREAKDTTSTEMVDKDEDWIAEPVLWTTEWIHLGSLMAWQDSVLILVDPQKFSETMQLNPSAFSLACTYARNYLEWLNNVREEALNDISQGEDVSEMVASFCGDKRAIMESGTSLVTRTQSNLPTRHSFPRHWASSMLVR
jgi:hypothetical protein